MGEWTADKVRGILVNPVYAGIGPFKRVVSDEIWIKAFQKVMQEIGTEVALTAMLRELRESFPEDEPDWAGARHHPELDEPEPSEG